MLTGQLALIAVALFSAAYMAEVVRAVIGLGLNVRMPAAAAFVVRSGEKDAGGPALTRYLFLDQALNTIGEHSDDGNVLDPRTHPWYQQAIRTDETVLTVEFKVNLLAAAPTFRRGCRLVKQVSLRAIFR